MPDYSEKDIPLEIQESLKLNGLKKHILESLPKNSRILSILSNWSPQDIFEILPKINAISESHHGYIFEAIFKKLREKGDRGNDTDNIIRSAFEKIFESDQQQKYFDKFVPPDAVDIENRKVVRVYECKTSEKALAKMKPNTPRKAIETVKQLIKLINNKSLTIQDSQLQELHYLCNGILQPVDDLQFVFVFPQEMENESLEKELKEKYNASVVYIPVTYYDTHAIYMASVNFFHGYTG